MTNASVAKKRSSAKKPAKVSEHKESEEVESIPSNIDHDPKKIGVNGSGLAVAAKNAIAEISDPDREPEPKNAKKNKAPSQGATVKATVIASSNGGNLAIPLSAVTEKTADPGKAGLEAPPEVTIPDEVVGESQLEKARRVLQGTKGRASGIRQWLVKNGLPFVRQVDDIVKSEGEDYLEMAIEVVTTKDGEKSTVQKPAGQVRNEFVDSIDGYLNWPEDGVVGKLIRRAGHSAVVMFEIGQAQSLPDLHSALADIYRRGYLDEAEDGKIRGPGGKNYSLTDDKRFGEMGNDPETVKEIVDLINVQVARFRREFYQDAKAVERRLVGESKMSIADLCDGQVTGNGLCALKLVPHDRFRDEGVLQVRLDEDGRIWPMVGSGRLQEIVASLQNSKAFITLDSLFNADGDLEEKPPRFNSRIRLGEEEFRAWVGLRIKFWHWVRQGVANSLRESERQKKAEEAKQAGAERIQKIKDALTDDRPIIDEKQWLSGKAGDTILVNERWDDNGKLYPLVVVRVRREVKDEAFISIVSTSPDSAELFDGVKGEYAEGERFQGVKDPLGRFLRAMYGMRFGGVRR